MVKGAGQGMSKIVISSGDKGENGEGDWARDVSP